MGDGVSGARVRSDTAPEVRDRGPVALALRPFGYLLIGLVWAALSTVILALGPGMLAFLVWADVTGALGEVELITGGVAESLHNPAEVIAIVISLPLLALLWGAGVLWMLPCAALPPMLLSFTFLVRSLRPSYADDALSFTTRGARGSTMGVTLTQVSLSLLPVHRSRWTDTLMRFYVAGWAVSLRAMTAAIPAGFGWLAAVLATMEDLPTTVRVLLAAAAVGSVGWSAVLLRKHWRARFHGESTGRSERPITDLSADERDRRRRALEKRRAARLSRR
ncbi:hypothetical protein SAMN05216284_101291 [Micromonospora sediminimaris]|uniref:Uncharacterized protein n=1 Tax=Micromonospora sediminimaris TaxID=547162 RepID=A0A9W5XL53_9ACTN|nr:hypothetical protein Vse01_37720 [Micromonospora sediminimaris]SFB83594.1 hypothetical protein SAMN05216284_101291 [Micromonospora sediminimaris]